MTAHTRSIAYTDTLPMPTPMPLAPSLPTSLLIALPTSLPHRPPHSPPHRPPHLPPHRPPGEGARARALPRGRARQLLQPGRAGGRDGGALRQELRAGPPPPTTTLGAPCTLLEPSPFLPPRADPPGGEARAGRAGAHRLRPLQLQQPLQLLRRGAARGQGGGGDGEGQWGDGLGRLCRRRAGLEGRRPAARGGGVAGAQARRQAW